MNLRYNMKFRKLIIKISYLLPKQIQERVNDWLYPDDMIISFGG